MWARTVGLRGCGYFPGIRIIPDYQAQFAETFIIMSSNGRKIPEDESANAASDDDTRIPMADEILDDEEELATTEEESNAASNVATGGGPDRCPSFLSFIILSLSTTCCTSISYDTQPHLTRRG